MLITQGKTKAIYKTSQVTGDGIPVVEFRQTGDAVLADGTSTISLGGDYALLTRQFIIEQNHNIYTLLNGLGFQTSYIGRSREGLYHKLCEPYLLEFVTRFAICNGSSILRRQPEQYGAPSQQMLLPYADSLTHLAYSSEEAHSRFFNEDGTVIPLDKPILETFHKKMLIEKPDGTVDLVLESEAKKDKRYYEDGKLTGFAHEDPLLVTPNGESRSWNIYDQKKPLTAQKPLARIDSRCHSGGADLYKSKNKTSLVRPLNKSEAISASHESALQKETQRILHAICTAALMTNFQKAEFKNDKIVFTDYIGGAFIIDGKCEFGRVKHKGVESIVLTDDLICDNMRWAFGGKPDISLRRMFQNYESPEKRIEVLATVAKGTRRWTDPNFIRKVKSKISQGR